VSDVPLARQALRKLIPGRIEFHPVERDGERGYHLLWAIVTKALLDSSARCSSGYIGVASPPRDPLSRVRLPFYREAASARR